MEKGLILALFASVSFAVCAIIIRKTVAQTGESFTAMVISVFIGIPFFAVALFFSGEWSKLFSVSSRAFISLGIAGIIHFIVGRWLSYSALRFIGANKTTPLLMTNPFYTVTFSILFLQESLTIYLVLGLLCIFAGAALITTEKESVSEERQEALFSNNVKGILVALGAALCWGITPILIKPAVTEIGSPVVGAFISYVTASIVTALLFLRRQHREYMGRLTLVATLLPLVISGLLASAGQLLNYTALSMSPASLISPLMGTQIFFIFFLSFLVNRQIEVFTPKVIIGMVATGVGTFFIFQ
jgi:drug/metabolite transporter (DMT)-like permease